MTAQGILAQLSDLAGNLWWTGDDGATAIWNRVDAALFAEDLNPVSLLADVDSSQLATLEGDETFRAQVRDALARRHAELSGNQLWNEGGDPLAGRTVAYLSMEFGLHVSLPIYSGGLGVLAGDHVRSASDLGVPLVAVGILWREGYFRQVLHHGRQTEAWPALDPSRAPLSPVRDSEGRHLWVEVPVGARRVRLLAWRVDVGRVPLFLLDADCDPNTPEDRAITARLYGGEGRNRLIQEVVLGLGGIVLLSAIGRRPDVIHLNEGHCALAILGRTSEYEASSSGFEAALQRATADIVFTTHTPVPAGHDRFTLDDVRSVLGPWIGQQGWSVDRIMGLGRLRPSDPNETLCMTVLALRGSRAANGVAALHGVTSRHMWAELYPGVDVAQVPIGHVTNGVHPIAWVAPEMRAMFDTCCPGWRQRPWDERLWAGIEQVDAEKLWQAREPCRTRVREAISRRTGVDVPPNKLVFGFARRFAPYKRADLLLSELDRLLPLLDDAVVVFAGKAHPRDAAGKEMLARVSAHTRSRAVRGRIFLLEEYDLSLGALLTSGCDAWINTPRRPQEASGTSGQKAALNGVPNVSVLDGWWPEAFDGTNGWAIGGPSQSHDIATQDAEDRASLYQTLTERVLPCWRDRAAWSDVARRSIRVAGPLFSSHRMVRDYAREWYYRPS